MKYEWRKIDKNLYLPKTKPVILEVPKMSYIVIDGVGNPNEEDFSHRIQALYAIAYGIKMSYRKATPPENYYEYTVFPLEGVWDLSAAAKKQEQWTKDDLVYSIMIRQPDFIDEKLFKEFQQEAWEKKNIDMIQEVYFKETAEGTCVQCLHIGSYDDEKITFATMDEYIAEQGYERLDLRHREIYLGDPRKAEPEKLKTTLRYKIRKI